MKLVLIRHGESVWNKENLFTGWTDVELSEKGVEEAKEAGALLKEAGLDFDLCYTSYLKRAICTQSYVLKEIDRVFLPVIKSWRLNERHYGALQGLNKQETAQKYGEEQVKIWRRSFDVRPPELEAGDKRCASLEVNYRDVDPYFLPKAESLKDTIARVVPYFLEFIKPQMLSGKRVLITAHGNSLRALAMYLEGLNEKEIMELNIPTGLPLVYELGSDFKVAKKYYLGDAEAAAKKAASVAAQGAK